MRFLSRLESLLLFVVRDDRKKSKKVLRSGSFLVVASKIPCGTLPFTEDQFPSDRNLRACSCLISLRETSITGIRTSYGQGEGERFIAVNGRPDRKSDRAGLSKQNSGDYSRFDKVAKVRCRAG